MTIYFYKLSDPYGCFSNFSPHPIEVDGLDWQTVEHYYQAQKFVATENERLIQVIRDAQTPMEAAQIGRDRTLKLRCDWEEVKQQVMWQGVLTKFLTHTDIQAILLDTGDRLIVEDSPTDYYWGCGQDKTGQNQLGKILMNVRQEIRQRLQGNLSFPKQE
ncbi:MAG: NADAR family protein [Coleofasciculaceae cyanobacterium]|jgi:N-glycosidase YbiA